MVKILRARAVADLKDRLLGTPALLSTLAAEHEAGADLASPDLDTAVIVHGLLGSARNWRTLRKHLQEQATAQTGRPWQVIALDLRCHGRSGQLTFPPPHNLSTAAGDISAYVDACLAGRAPRVLIGHSLGGKVVLEYLKQRAQQDAAVPEQVWSLDSPVGQAVPGSEEPTEIDNVLQAVADVPLPVDSREALYKRMRSQGFSLGLQQWMGSNLTPGPDQGLVWAFDLAGARSMYKSFQRAAYWKVLEKPPSSTSVHIVRAERSDRWSEKAISQLQTVSRKASGRVHLHVLADAGHWLHADNPTGLSELLLKEWPRAKQAKAPS